MLLVQHSLAVISKYTHEKLSNSSPKIPNSAILDLSSTLFKIVFFQYGNIKRMM